MKNENVEDRRALLRGGRRYVMAYGCARAWATLTFTGASAGAIGGPAGGAAGGAAVAAAIPWSFDTHFTFDLAYIVVSILLVLLFRRFIPPQRESHDEVRVVRVHARGFDCRSLGPVGARSVVFSDGGRLACCGGGIRPLFAVGC